ncbi:MAG: hypothetical protein ACHQ6U_09165 [Thermodesulfobacteriota bacterium]
MTQRIELTENISEFIDESGIQIKHPVKEKLYLRDIYVFPDLRVLTPRSGTGATYPGDAGGSSLKSSAGLSDAVQHGTGTLICGPEDSGKTSLLKILASRFLDSGIYTLYIDGKSLDVPPVERMHEYFITKYSKQYTVESFGWIKADREEKRTLLLDNADRIMGRSQDRGVFFGKLTECFGAVFLTAETPPEFTELPEGFSVYGVPEGFAVYEIMELGHALRQEMISKWTDLGAPEYGDVVKAASRKARLAGAMDAVLGRNIVPSYPVFILTTLQMADSDDLGAPSVSSYGHYYEYLITKSLAGATGREEFPFYSELLSSLAYRMFCRRSRWISRRDIWTLIETLSADSPHSPINVEESISVLLKSHTLAERESGYEFRYGYIYHYFSALHFARNLHSERLRDEVKRIFGNLDNEENANIALFLAHLSNDTFVVEQVARNVEYAASCEDPYRAEEEEAYLDELIRELNHLIDKDRRLREMRAEYSPDVETAARKPIGFRVLGTDILTRKRRETPRPGSSRKPLVIRALLRISSETLYGRPAECQRTLPQGFDENVSELCTSSLRIKKREADRVRESAAAMKGQIFQNNFGTTEKFSFILEIYGLYMRIYLNGMRQLSLLTEASPPEYSNTIPDRLMRICAGLFRKDHSPGDETIGKFLEENAERGFAKELVRECATLRFYIFGRDSEYSEEILRLLG